MKKQNPIIKCANKKCKKSIDLSFYDPNSYAYKLFNFKTKKFEFFCCHSCYEQARIERERELLPKNMRSKFIIGQAVGIKKGNTPFQQDFANRYGRVFDIQKIGKKFVYEINFDGHLMKGIDENLLVSKR